MPRRSLLRFLYDFWATPIRAEPLALFRIAMGTTILLSLLTSVGPNLARYLGPNGILPGQAMDDWQRRSCRFCLLRGPVNVPLLDDKLPARVVGVKEDKIEPSIPFYERSGMLTPERIGAWQEWCEAPEHVYWIFAVLVLAMACMTLGFCTRVSTIVAWALFVSFNQRLTWVNNGGDSMMRVGLFYLMFAPSGAVWSLDRLLWRWWRRGAAPASEPVLIPAWSVRLIQIQLCFVYFFTALSKLGLDWYDGEAVYWMFNDTSLNRWPYSRLPVPLFLCRLFTWGTLVFEFSFGFFVLFGKRRRFVLEAAGKSPEAGFRCAITIPALRPWLLLGGVALHMGILIHTEVGWFSPATVSYYAVFLSGETLDWFVHLRWLRRMRAVDVPNEEPQSAHPVAV